MAWSQRAAQGAVDEGIVEIPDRCKGELRPGFLHWIRMDFLSPHKIFHLGME
jgi:hypothetical protein